MLGGRKARLIDKVEASWRNGIAALRSGLGGVKVNFVKYGSVSARVSKSRIVLCYLITILLSVCFVGCEGPASSVMQLAEFEDAGPVIPNIDMDLLMRSRIGGAPLPGEVLQITMPAILQVVTVENPLHATDSYACRVSESGTITLPAVGEIEVAEKTLVEIESAIVDAYYPEYATTRPAVFVNLVEQIENPLYTVLGLVNNPGNYPYSPDARYNIMQAIGAAGGMGEGEPRYANVYRLKPDGTIVSATFKIANTGDISGLTDALSTIIKPGDIIDVARTARTRINAIVDKMFHFSTGAYWDITDDRN